ncbi:hypothetical protein D3C73_809760 [compost metagenome]
MREDKAIFEARITAGRAQSWELVKYWADTAETHKILIFCRTLRLASKINVLIDINDGDVGRRRTEAKNAGFTSYETNVNRSNAMVYYRP